MKAVLTQEVCGVDISLIEVPVLQDAHLSHLVVWMPWQGRRWQAQTVGDQTPIFCTVQYM